MTALRTAVTAALLSATAALAQTTPAPTAAQLSPKAAYDDAMRPLTRTRSAVSNWSDAEIAALQVTIARALKSCEEHDAGKLSGEDLVDLAHLCALGQDFPRVVTAATLYLKIDGPQPSKTGAYAELVNAELHLKQEPAALKDAKTMLASVPYDAAVADTIDLALNYMQFVHTTDALELGAAREPLLLARMKALATPAATPDSPPGGEAPLAIHDLYADGLALAALQQLARMDASGTVADLDAALPTPLVPDEALPIALARKRYALLGKPLPAIAATSFLTTPGDLPAIPANHAVTGLLMFPDWCAACIQMGTKMPTSVFLVEGHEAYLYGLLATTTRQKPTTDKVPSPSFNPADASNLLRETPTEVVSLHTLDDFAASDLPYLVLTDANGIVRVAQPVTEDAIVPGGFIDSAIARVSERWPAVVPKAPGATGSLGATGAVGATAHTGPALR